MLKTILKPNAPIYAIFFITAVCNARCSFCFNWESVWNWRDKKELTIEEIEKIASNFGELPYLTLSGGEPFLRKDIVEIVRLFHKKAGTKFVTIPTNGSMSKKIRDDVEGMLKLGVHVNIRMSIDDLFEKHDKVRKLKDGFKKLMETYRLLNELRVKYKKFNLDIMTVYNQTNKERIREIFNYFKDFKLNHHYLGLIRVDSKEREFTDVSIDDYEKTIKWIRNAHPRREKRMFGRIFRALDDMNDEISIQTYRTGFVQPCFAGRKLIVIDEQGEVLPCEILDKKEKGFGNLRDYDYDIKKILNNKKSKEVVKWIKETKCHCTWGCANFINTIYNPKMYPKLLAKSLKYKMTDDSRDKIIFDNIKPQPVTY